MAVKYQGVYSYVDIPTIAVWVISITSASAIFVIIYTSRQPRAVPRHTASMYYQLTVRRCMFLHWK